MISVGIDVSKEKSTVCILKPYGEIVRKPFDIYHTQTELTRLSTIIRDLDEEVRVVMEATGYPLHIIEDAAHFSNGDNAEQVNSEIEQFVIQTTVG